MTPELAIGLSLLVPTLFTALGCSSSSACLAPQRSRGDREHRGHLAHPADLRHGPAARARRWWPVERHPNCRCFEVMPGLELAVRARAAGHGLRPRGRRGCGSPPRIYAIGYLRGHHEQNQTRFFACFRRWPSSAALGIAFSRQPADAVPLLRGADVLDLPPGHPPRAPPKRPPRRPDLPGHPGLHERRACCSSASSGPGSSRARVEFAAGRDPRGDVDPTLKLTVAAGAVCLRGTGKAALMPFHRWLPNAMVAPTPVSRAAPRCGRGEGRRLHGAQGHRLRLRHRDLLADDGSERSGSWPWPPSPSWPRSHRGLGVGQPQGPAGLLAPSVSSSYIVLAEPRFATSVGVIAWRHPHRDGPRHRARSPCSSWQA